MRVVGDRMADEAMILANVAAGRIVEYDGRLYQPESTPDVLAVAQRLAWASGYLLKAEEKSRPKYKRVPFAENGGGGE
jgi:hypothetical protein